MYLKFLSVANPCEYIVSMLRRTERARNNDAIIDDVVTFDLGPNPQPQTLTTSSERE